MTKLVAARVYAGRSFQRDRSDGRQALDRAPRKLVAQDHQWLVLPAESFFSIARYVDQAALDVGRSPPNFLSHSHGEGFLRFFEERCQRQGIFVFDEPESALSPSRQIEFLKLMRRMDDIGHCQIIMATHSPMLMAYPSAQLLRLTKYGLDPVTVKDTDHYKVMREFCDDPAGFVEAAIEE